MLATTSGSSLNVAGHLVCFDGTKSDAHKTCKMQNLQNQMLYLTEAGEIGPHEVWADSLVDQTVGRKALATFDLVMRHLNCCGCPSLVTDISHLEADAFRLSMVASDDAGDCRVVRSLFRSILSKRRNASFVEIACLLHQSPLGCRKQLSLINQLSLLWRLPHSYYSGLVKFAHSSRNQHHAAYAIWSSTFGKDSVDDVVKKSMPMPIATRWGSLSDAESYSDSAEPSCFVRVWELLTAKDTSTKGPGTAAAKAPAAAGALDEISVDEMAKMKELRSRWGRELMLALRDPRWWL